ncbi:voltage-dependent anion channel-domain-containing protein [Aspergillus coremiiformis]|uniref:Voltage-dependent anion channel-domain-containing protein n=1 Tax=Aspergillus coremiiformis TaxID=138285 RepID=A0A5N6Z1M0_9EURO|nr:voltage-dependent anion channel-domain-containing protein [Aspergillus coremiiformis]
MVLEVARTHIKLWPVQTKAQNNSSSPNMTWAGGELFAISPLRKLRRLNAGRTFLVTFRKQMVLCYDGHRDCVNLTEHTALSCRMALLDLGGHLRPQCASLCYRMHHHHSPLYLVSRDFHRDDYPSGAVDVSWNISNGLRDDCQHVLLCLRPRLGRMGPELCLGDVDIGCHPFGHHGSFAAIFIVRCMRFSRLSVEADFNHIRMAHGGETQLSSMTAVWLLPIVSCVVAGSSGGIVADVLSNAQHALWTVIISYILWGIGLPLAMMVMVIYLQRLTLHKIPPKAVIVSVFLPLGPLSQGGFGYVFFFSFLFVSPPLDELRFNIGRILKLGKAAQSIFPQTQTLHPSSGEIFYAVGFLTALILWSFALVWLFFALVSIVRCKSFPFNIGWWGFTFPLGVFATCTCEMGKELSSEFFRVLGTVGSLSQSRSM